MGENSVARHYPGTHTVRDSPGRTTVITLREGSSLGWSLSRWADTGLGATSAGTIDHVCTSIQPRKM